MTNENEEFRSWAGPIGGVEVREINHLVINRVIEACDDTPFKQFDVRTDGDWEACEYLPDFKSNRLFPTHGLREANRLASLLAETAAKRTDVVDLRMITLRLKGERPAFDKLDDHLRELSAAVSRLAEDVQRQTKAHPAGLARPILTTIHIRVTDDGAERFDPHVHGIWHIGDQDIEKVERKLGDTFGQVWIDREPVRSLKRAAFYIAQGIIDYRGLRSWPDAAIKAVWDMAQLRMFRKAGWLASESRTVAVVPGDEDGLGHESAQEALVGHLRDHGDHDLMAGVSASQEGVMEANSMAMDSPAWKGALFPFMRPYRPSASPPNYTVRPASPNLVDLTRYPSLGDIQATAIAIVESEQRDFDRSSTEVFTAYGMDKEQVAVAIARTEAYFHLTMFHAGMGWVPTPQGVAWAVTVMSALDLLRGAAVVGKSELLGSYRDEQRLPNHLRRK